MYHFNLILCPIFIFLSACAIEPVVNSSELQERYEESSIEIPRPTEEHALKNNMLTPTELQRLLIEHSDITIRRLEDSLLPRIDEVRMSREQMEEMVNRILIGLNLNQGVEGEITVNLDTNTLENTLLQHFPKELSNRLKLEMSALLEETKKTMPIPIVNVPPFPEFPAEITASIDNGLTRSDIEAAVRSGIDDYLKRFAGITEEGFKAILFEALKKLPQPVINTPDWPAQFEVNVPDVNVVVKSGGGENNDDESSIWREAKDWQTLVAALFALCVAIWGYVSIVSSARKRATLDFQEKFASEPYYRLNKSIFYKYAREYREGRLRSISNISEYDEEMKRYVGILSYKDEGASAIADSIMEHISHFEQAAVGIKSGILDEEMYKDLMLGSVIITWNNAAPFIQQIRYSEAADKILYRNLAYSDFEALAELWWTERTKGPKKPNSYWPLEWLRYQREKKRFNRDYQKYNANPIRYTKLYPVEDSSSELHLKYIPKDIRDSYAEKFHDTYAEEFQYVKNKAPNAQSGLLSKT